MRIVRAILPVFLVIVALFATHAIPTVEAEDTTIEVITIEVVDPDSATSFTFIVNVTNPANSPNARNVTVQVGFGCSDGDINITEDAIKVKICIPNRP